MVAAVVVAWTAWTWVVRVAPRAEERWLVPLCIGALAVLAVTNIVSAVRGDPPHQAESVRMRALVPPVVATLPSRDGDVIVRDSSFSSSIYAAGLVLALERRHYAARVDPSSKVAFLEHRVHRRGKVREVLTVTANDTFDDYISRPDLRLVAYTGRVSPASGRASCNARPRWIGHTVRASSTTSRSTSDAARSRRSSPNRSWGCSPAVRGPPG